MHYVYIIHSKKLNRFYAGETGDIEDRIEGHNSNRNRFTGKSNDWVLVWKTELQDRRLALILEKKIKHRGIRRFLEDNKIVFVLEIVFRVNL